MAALSHGFGDHLLGAEPDFVGIVLHPSGLRIDLLVLLLRAGGDAARAVKTMNRVLVVP